MRMNKLAGLLAAPLMTLAMLTPAHAADSAAPRACKDGTTSEATGRGACSGHGGVQKASKSKPASNTAAAPEPAAPAATPSAAPTSGASTTMAPSATAATAPAASGSAPAGATAKCKDGSYSKSKHHSGSCSSHGGVAQWLTAPAQ